MIKKQDLPNCPVATTLQIIGSKWKVWILLELQRKPWRFGELRKSLAGISRHVLNTSLKSMLQDGIIDKKILSLSPHCVEYRLSELGNTLLPVLETMKAWGLEYQKRAN